MKGDAWESWTEHLQQLSHLEKSHGIREPLCPHCVHRVHSDGIFPGREGSVNIKSHSVELVDGRV